MDVIGSDSFSEKLAGRLDARHIRIERRTFPDGEVCPRLAWSPGNEVVLAERMSLPLYPNQYLAEVLLVLKNLKAMKVGNISMVMPYFVYSRQDRSFMPGEPFSAKHVLELLADSGVSRFFTVSSHMERFKPQLTAPGVMSAHNLDGYSMLGEHIKGLGLRDPIVMGPDMAVSMAAERVASILGPGSESINISKHRNLDTGEISIRGLGGPGMKASFSGRDLVILDDIISTGGTMVKAIETAEKNGCGRVVVAAVHAVQQSGLDLLKKRTWRVITTDTVGTPFSDVSVIEKVADAIKGQASSWAQPSAETVSATSQQDGTKPEEKPGEASSDDAIASAFSWFN